VMVAYAAHVTQRDLSQANGIPPVYVWLWQASMYGDLRQSDQELACLEQAYRCDQHVFRVRQRLGFALQDAGRYSEAEPHLRWCLARRPENKELNGALVEITKQRYSQRKLASVPAMAGDATLRR
jgi:tetratricopeptide (TPR) repeat protein